MYKAVFVFPFNTAFYFLLTACYSDCTGVFGAVFLQVHVTSLPADVHGIFSLLGGR